MASEKQILRFAQDDLGVLVPVDEAAAQRDDPQDDCEHDVLLHMSVCLIRLLQLHRSVLTARAQRAVAARRDR